MLISSTFEKLIAVIGLLQCREVITAYAGIKSVRIAVKPPKLKALIHLLQELNLYYIVSDDLIFCRKDIGKGGWSNKFDTRPNLPRKKGEHLVYVGSNKKKLLKAVKADLNGDDSEFGYELGIPSCCVNFYVANSDKAYQKQNDFVTLVYDNTNHKKPFNHLNNFVSQYFGYSFLSFFPCSFDCLGSAQLSLDTFELVKSFIPRYADKTLYFMQQPILYTEYRGVYLFENAIVSDRCVTIKNSTIHSTLPNSSKTNQFISSTQTMEILEDGDIKFTKYTGEQKLIKSDNWRLCIFQ